MRHTDLRRLTGTLLFGLGLAGFIALLVSLPAIWLVWEAGESHARAALVANADAARVQTALSDVFARFDRATASIQAQDLRGDAVSLTGRLLRAEPLVQPAAGLIVVNNRGAQVASTLVGAAPITAPAWWYRTHPLPAIREAAVLGCGVAPVDAPGWMLVRDIEGTPDGIAGQVASSLPAAALRTLVAQGGNAVDYVLADADGCVLLRAGAETRSPVPAAILIRLYQALLPARLLIPEPIVATIKAGNLTWTGTIDPDGALVARAAEIDEHGRIVLILLATLSGLTLLTLIARPGRTVAAPPEAETTSQEMVDLREKLDGMTGERDRVLAAIGHDVRTPMTSIQGICALLLDGDVDEGQRKWLWRIRASCEALLVMLNGMLEIAAAGMDAAEIHREPIDVASLAQEVGEVLRPQAEDKGLDLIVAVDQSVLGVWNTDPTRLRQVLFNLGGNAIKYTNDGSVEINALTERDAAGHELLRLTVVDTGPGIAEDEREVIFERFRRGRDEVSRGQEGLGLGLALCREIATLLGGTLSLESGKDGSVFTFEIPIERGQSSLAFDGPLAGRTALVVGLSEGVRRGVASHLEGIGFEVETASDGFMAIGLAERMAYRHGTLDLMVVDAALAGLPADALLARLKASRPLEHMRAILVTNGQEPIQGADATVAHPVEARDLDHAVAGLFGGRTTLREIDPRAPAAPRPRILVVEDNRIAQALAVDQLNRAGFSTFTASNGREAIEAARRGGFDVILMDVQMPEIDGIEATRTIRSGEVGHRIPIIGMTAHTGSGVRERCLEAGMDLVLDKPVDFASLPLRLREVAAAAATQFEHDDAAAPRNTLEIADEYLELLLAEVGVKRTRTYVIAFLADTAVHVAMMARLVQDAEWDDLARLAHSLSGIAAALGAIALADGMLMLEDAARLNKQAQAEAALADVRQTWERTRITLRPRFEALVSGRDGGGTKRAA
jgi:signal transduction histidine kinase/CheY-like chemotaxis protein